MKKSLSKMKTTLEQTLRANTMMNLSHSIRIVSYPPIRNFPQYINTFIIHKIDNHSHFSHLESRNPRSGAMARPSLLLPLVFFAIPLLTATAIPLFTNSRWIVTEDGARVKLACVNWVAHLDAVVAEGLSKQPVDSISKGIKSMGFNCVRLTWPILLVTDESLANLTVRKSFQKLGLLDSLAGVQANNPSVIDLPLIQAYQVAHSPNFDSSISCFLSLYLFSSVMPLLNLPRN